MSESLFCTETLSKKRSKPFVWRTACNISREDINSTAATMRHSTSSCKQMMLVNNCSETDRSWNSNPPLSDWLSCAGCPSQKEKQGNVAPAQFPSLGAAGSRWRGSDIALLCARSPPGLFSATRCWHGTPCLSQLGLGPLGPMNQIMHQTASPWV